MEHHTSQTETQLCNEYCKRQEEKLTNSMIHYLMNTTNIYDSFKPRPECSSTAVSYTDASYHQTIISPDPIRFEREPGIAEFDCVNSVEILFIATGVLMSLSFLLLIYHHKKVRVGAFI